MIAREKYIEQYQRLFTLFRQAYDYNYLLISLGLAEQSYVEIIECLLAKSYGYLIRELNIWCFKYQNIINTFDLEDLEKLSQWHIRENDQLETKKFEIDLKINRYATAVFIVK